MKTQQTQTGLTLIEVLLLLVIVTIFIYTGLGYMQQKTLETQIDKTVAQMQQILNAGMAYYVVNGSWPVTANDCTLPTLTSLKPNYLPNVTIKNPWGSDYCITVNTATNPTNTKFYVWAWVGPAPVTSKTLAITSAVAGRLPNGYTSTAWPNSAITACAVGNSGCNVIAYVDIPGQNLSNTSTPNFAGLYHHGACVPVPSCPNDASGAATTAQITVVPVSVSGVNDQGSTKVYSISSYTAYATASAAISTLSGPLSCSTDSGTGTAAPCYLTGTANTAGTLIPGNNSYWRVCLQLITKHGDVTATRTDEWGNNVTLAVFTRCVLSNESSGSDFTVYGK